MHVNDVEILSFIIAPIASYSFTVLVEKIAKRKGILAEDMHKQRGRKLPRIGGLGFLLGITLAMSIISISPELRQTVLMALAVSWTAGLIGFIDDLKKLGGKTKVLLTTIPGILLGVAHWYTPYLYLPFIGTIRVSIVYPLMLPVIFAVSSNAINMIDTFTGIAPSVTFILVSTGIASMYINGLHSQPIQLISMMVALSLLGYIPRNYYPGKTFNGDTGTLAWGALLAFIGVTGKIEAFLVLAAMPIVTNGFTILASIRGIIEHEKIKERPTIADRERNVIKANPSKDSPITLAHLLSLQTEMKEHEIVIATIIIVLLSSVLTICIQTVLVG